MPELNDTSTPAQSFAFFGLALLAAASEPIRLPVTVVQSTPVTTITVGDQTVRAIVDTGGGVLTLSREVIDAAGGVKLADMQVSNDASGNEYAHARFRLPRIDIGGRLLRDSVVIEAPVREAGNGPPVPNSIGRQFLSQYFVVVDYAGELSLCGRPIPGKRAARSAACADSDGAYGGRTPRGERV